MRSLEEIQADNAAQVEKAQQALKSTAWDPAKGEAPLVVEVTRTRHSPDALFFSEVWMSGTGDDGSKVELTRTVGGGALVLEIERPDGTKTVETIDMIPLVQAWAKAIDNEKEN